ncbi:hypothetical protein BJV78DRAFT_1218500 [Lactifluus subvellereus]|nr:hypothetical protein BJV78DRAFT_1218500 [Lactifluus subvellereus]
MVATVSKAGPGPGRACPIAFFAMAASPNSVTRSHSSSAATPDGLDPLLKTFRRAIVWKAQRTHDTLHSAKRRKVASPTCGTCGLTPPRPFVCLDCAFFGCWQDDHILDHLKYDNHRFYNIYQQIVLGIEERETKLLDEKRPREPYRSWTPGEKDNLVLDNTSLLPCQGQRGLLNLALLHNPLLRNYFLARPTLLRHTHAAPQPAFGPTALLATTWRAAGSLAGYAQQDAHECFIALLNTAHASARGSTLLKCNCIVHSTFGGMLQSDMRRPAATNTLAGCLKRFTQSENLSVKDWSCQKCGKVSHEANKRLSIKRLPPVLSVQFKRFEQRGTETYKIDTPVRVPSSINIAPGTYPGPEALYDYELFAVINHEGQIDNGHYTSFARFQDTWCRFDDDKVTPATLAGMLGASAPVYMTFYVKRRLDYKPFITPTYILARESEAVREREALAAKARAEKEQAQARRLLASAGA